MINSDFKKKMADSWFSYLQSQICKEFEIFEKGKKKFIRRDWYKKNKNEGGGTSFLLSKGNLFEKVGVNKSTVSGTFTKEFRGKVLGAKKDISKGEKFTIDNVNFMRIEESYNALLASEWNQVVGKISKKNIKKYTLITKNEY